MIKLKMNKMCLLHLGGFYCRTDVVELIEFWRSAAGKNNKICTVVYRIVKSMSRVH